MDRSMFPRTTVEIDLVQDLCDKRRYELLGAVMSFCCRQTRSTVPCRDFETMRVWCGVTPQWWSRWGAQTVALIPPLGGGSYGFPEIECAWESHKKWADTNRIKGMKSGVARRIKKLRKPVKPVSLEDRTQCSTEREQSQPQPQRRAPPPALPAPAVPVAPGPIALVASSDGERGQHPPSSATHVSKAGREPVSARCPQCGVVYARWLEGGQLIRAACEQCPGLVWLEVVPATAPAAPRGAAERKNNVNRVPAKSPVSVPAVPRRSGAPKLHDERLRAVVPKVRTQSGLGGRSAAKRRKTASTNAAGRAAAMRVNPQPGRKSGGGSRTAAAAAARRRR